MPNVRIRIFGNALLKEICFSLQGNHFHKIKWIGGLVELVVAQRY